MLQARKQALENSARQRMVEIRNQELNYYTDNCRSIGNSAALVAGLAYSGIRYHYLLERKQNYRSTTGDSIEAMFFLSLLSITLGTALQTVYVAMLVALFGPHLALRGPDGALHDAVEGMHVWNSVVLALFFTSLLLLQLSAFSFMYGHSQLNGGYRALCMLAVLVGLLACLHYARLIIRRLRVPKEHRVTGAFYATEDADSIADGFHDATHEKAALCSGRGPSLPGVDATRISEDTGKPLTAEAVDEALRPLYEPQSPKRDADGDEFKGDDQGDALGAARAAGGAGGTLDPLALTPVFGGSFGVNAAAAGHARQMGCGDDSDDLEDEDAPLVGSASTNRRSFRGERRKRAQRAGSTSGRSADRDVRLRSSTSSVGGEGGRGGRGRGSSSSSHGGSTTARGRRPLTMVENFLNVQLGAIAPATEETHPAWEPGMETDMLARIFWFGSSRPSRMVGFGNNPRERRNRQ